MAIVGQKGRWSFPCVVSYQSWNRQTDGQTDRQTDTSDRCFTLFAMVAANVIILHLREHRIFAVDLGQGLCICRVSVRLSVCLSQHGPQQQTLLCGRPAGGIDRLLHGAQQRCVRRANAGSATLSAYVGS